MNYPKVILAGTNSGVGKTTLSIGIMLALKKRGLVVQPFKIGPDYIDPAYHTQAIGRISSNLDTWLLSQSTILDLFKRRAKDADISIIEGVMGLYDGVRDKEEGSTAHLSKLLNSPVVLILNARSLSRSAAAIVLGYSEFDKKVNISGVILNNIGSKSHYGYIKSAIESKTKIRVLGYLPKHPDLKLPERHLGLIPAQERKLDAGFYKKLLNLIKENIDIEAILQISRQSPLLPYYKTHILSTKPAEKLITIGIAYDKAFHFYYQDNLDILKHRGVKLIRFSPLQDKKLPQDINGLYIGGGFPEVFAHQLSKNTRLKKEIYERAQARLPIYAECGGLMYLVERIIDFKKREFQMVGIFKDSVHMGNKLQALGYVNMEVIKDNILSKEGTKAKAHMFHWSYLGKRRRTPFAYRIKKNDDNIFYDGLIKKNVLASYAHLHFGSNPTFVRNFINVCQRYKKYNDKKNK